MKKNILIGLFAALAGCQGGAYVNPCEGRAEVCINVQVTGDVGNLDQLAVTLGSKALNTPATPSSFKLPTQFAMFPPPGLGGKQTLSADGLAGGQVIAHDAATFDVPSSGSVEVKLVMSANSFPPAPISISGAEAKTIYEYDNLSLPITLTDAKGIPFSFTVTNLPMGANFTPTSATSGNLTWVPNFRQAGSYQLQINVTSADPRRSMTVPFELTVKNGFDQVFHPAAAGQTTVYPIGDFDKDGYADLAICTENGSSYSVQIIYGDPTGLPTAGGGAYPQERTKLYQFAPFSNTPFSVRSCDGFDFDGDGYSDVVVLDAFNGSRVIGGSASSGAGRIFVLYGRPRSDSSTSFIELVDNDPQTGGENLGYTHAIGDFNGDGQQDLAVSAEGSAGSGANNRVYFFFGRQIRPTGGPISQSAAFYRAKLCNNQPTIQGFANIDGNPGDELLVWMDDVGAPGGSTCASPNPYGGLRVLRYSILNIFSTDYRRPSQESGNTYWGDGDAILCDVNGDGNADLNVRAQNNFWYYYFGSTTLFPSPLNNATAPFISPQSDLYSGAVCMKNFFGASTLVYANPAAYSKPGFLDLVTTSAGLPAVTVTLPNPEPADLAFGSYLPLDVHDINGDGKNDLFVGSNSLRWIVYGR